MQSPIAVTALTRADIDANQMIDLSDIADHVPNMTFDFTTPLSGSSNSASVFIRGVGQTDYVPNKDPGVGIYVNGVYVSRSVGSVLNLLDVDRIEVLRGPQGTLFGRNTIGGAINVLSRRPEADFSGSLDVTVGSFDRADFRGWVNTPLAGNMNALWSFARLQRDGYLRRIAAGDKMGDDDELVGRAVLDWAPTDDVDVSLSVDWSEADERSTASKLLSTDARVPTSPFSIGDTATVFAGQAYNVLIGAQDTGASSLFPFLPPLPAETARYDRRWLTDGNFETYGTGPNYSTQTVSGLGLSLDWRLQPFTVSSVTGYRETEASFGRDPDGSPLAIAESEVRAKYRQFSQELRVAGHGWSDRLNWTAGIFYLSENGRQRDLVPFVDETFRIYEGLDIPIGNFLLIDGPYSVNDIESLALFGEGSVDVSDRLELTVGMRVTEEDRSTIANTTTGGLPNVVRPEASLSFSDTSGRIVVRYVPGQNHVTYLSYSDGFKSGGFNHRIPMSPPGLPLLESPTRFRPETVETIELGYKARFLDGGLRLNAALFRSDYRNIQVLVFDLGVPRTINAAAGRIDGFELEADWALLEHTRLRAALGLLDARYTRLDDDVPGSFGLPIGMPLTLDSRFVNTPDTTLALGAQQLLQAGQWGELTFDFSASFRSETANDAFNTPELVQDDLWRFDAGLTVVPERCQCRIALLGTNLTDRHYFVSGAADSVTGGSAERIMARPREWAVRVSLDFD